MQTVTTIYLVIGSCGEYEGCMEWNTQSFFSESKAESFMAECQAHANWMMEEVESAEHGDSFPRYYSPELHKPSPDKQARYDYTGTNYHVESIELIGD